MSHYIQNYHDLLNTEFNCTCGKTHHIPIQKVVIEKDAVKQLGNILSELDYHHKVHLVSDINTYPIAGKQLAKLLSEQGYTVSSTYFDHEHLTADMDAVQTIVDTTDKDAECIVAVGSGTINDLSRYAAYKLKKHYIIFATAPSMDGYASSVSPLIVNGFKRTYPAVPPQAIIGDLHILCNAPTDMIAAGFGDLIGKLISQSDWKLSQVLNNEYYCEFISSLIDQTVQICIDNTGGLRIRDEKAIENLMHGLVLSGIGMLMVGNSRPASGCEHHLAHFWEMKYLQQGKEALLHGQKVGVASVLMAKLYNRITKYEKSEIENLIEDAKTLPKETVIEMIKNSFGDLAPEVIKENFENQEPHKDKKRIAFNWYEIRDIAKTVPDSQTIKKLLKSINAPATPDDLNLDASLVQEGLENCMYVRTRYTLPRLMDELGI